MANKSKKTQSAKASKANEGTPKHDASSSDNSDHEDQHAGSGSSSTSVEVTQTSNGVRKTTRTTRTTTTSRRQVTGSGSDSDSSANDAPSVGFITRVTSIPLVRDSVNTFQSIAESNKYGKYALDTATNAVDTVNKYTENYQRTLQPHISKVDQLANRSLDVIENKFPIITKDSSEIYSQVKKPIEIIDQSSRNVYNQVTSTLDSKVTTPAKNVTSNITTTASTAASQIASHLNDKTAPIVSGLETIANRYLPGQETTTNPNQNQVTRVMELTRSVSSRVSGRLGGPQSTQELYQLAENNMIVNRSKESIETVSQKLTELLGSLQTQTKDLIQTNVQDVSNQVHVRVISLSGAVVAQFESLTTFLKENSPDLPASLQQRLQPVIEYLNERLAVIKAEFAKSDLTVLQRTQNVLMITTEQTIPILLKAANDIKLILISYQIKAQENVQKGIDKVADFQSSFQRTASEAVHKVHFVFTGSK